jgi:hypothetical protein
MGIDDPDFLERRNAAAKARSAALEKFLARMAPGKKPAPGPAEGRTRAAPAERKPAPASAPKAAAKAVPEPAKKAAPEPAKKARETRPAAKGKTKKK